MRKLPLFFSIVIALLTSVSAHAIPDCHGPAGLLQIDNARVLSWKTERPNQYKERARIEGSFVSLTLDRTSHYQFVIQIGPRESDTIEVVYNKEFGPVPPVYPGMKVEACGDFINAFAQAGAYPPSPAGAIIHWVHMNPRNQGHAHGYLVMDGVLVGFETPASPRH